MPPDPFRNEQYLDLNTYICEGRFGRAGGFLVKKVDEDLFCSNVVSTIASFVALRMRQATRPATLCSLFFG